MKNYEEFLNENINIGFKNNRKELTSDQKSLVAAINNNNLQMVKNIIKGINVNVPIFKIFDDDKYYNRTPLIYVSSLKKIREYNLRYNNKKSNVTPADDNLILKELINAGADLNLQDKNGNTALIYCAYNNNILLLKELIKAGANLDIKDNNGCTALHIALSFKYKNIVIELINSGSDFNIKNYNEESFIDEFDFIADNGYLFFDESTRQEIINKCPNLQIFYNTKKYNL